jgi:hypothetical protein
MKKSVKSILVSLSLLLSCGLLKAQVVATGTGVTQEKALSSAFRNAIQQVVGVILDSETLVKNQQVIRDEILLYSSGYIERYNKIRERKNSDGLYEVTIKAEVQNRQLRAKLNAVRAAKGKVDGNSIFASVITQLDTAEKGAKLLEKGLTGLPGSLLKVEIVNSQPRLLNKTKNEVKVEWDIKVSWDEKKYRETVFPRLKQLLSDVQISRALKEEETVEVWLNRPGYYGQWQRNNSCEKYTLDQECYKVLKSQIGRSGWRDSHAVWVRLYSKSGTYPIHSGKTKAPVNFFADNSGFGIGPKFHSHGSKNPVYLKWQTTMRLDEIKNVTKIVAEID